MVAYAPPVVSPTDALFPEEPEESIGPQRDDDDPGFPKPKLSWTIADAEAEKSEHGLRIAQAMEMAEWLDHTRIGYFDVDEDKIKNNVVEVMPITTLRADHEYINGIIAGMDLYLALAARDVTETTEALIIEDALAFMRECEIRQHAAATGSLLRWAEPNHLQRFGMLAGLDTINPDDEVCGLDMSLVDPMTVFPVWGGKGGLVDVFRVYEDEPDNIIGNYGGKPGSAAHTKIRNKITKLVGKDAGGRIKRGTRHTVIEHWNGDWCQVVVDSHELCNRRHGYGEVPWTIVLGGFDLPPGVSSQQSKDPYILNSIWGELHVSDRAVDLARQARPYQWRKLKAHAVREAYAGRLLTTYRDADNPTWIHEMDPMTKHLNEGKISSDAGHVIEVTLGNRLSTLIKTPGAETVAPLDALLNTNAEQGSWSAINNGGIPPQTSDSAIGTMLELGGAAQSVLVGTLTLFHQQRAEARLRRWRDWGPALGPARDKGVLSFPSRQGYGSSSPVHKLTSELLGRTGCYVIADLFHWRPNPGMAHYISSMRAPGGSSGAPLISDETARRKLRVVQDPDREAHRIENEMIDSLPAIATQRALRRLDREIAEEVEAGDYEDADALMVAAIELEFERQKQMMMGQAAPPQLAAGAAAPAGAGAGDAPPEEPVGMEAPPGQQGLSPVQMGDGVGTQGGRPSSTKSTQEPQQPRMATQPQR